MKTVPRWVVAGATAYVAVAWAVTVVAGERQPAASAATLLELGAPVTAALLCRRASRRLGSRGWRFLALGCALWGAGEVAWLLLVAAGRESPFPSLADAGYLGGAGCFLAGMFALFFRRLSLAQHVRAGVDGLIASLALFFVFGALLESAVRQAHDLSLLAEWVALGYPIADLLVLSLVLTTLLGVGRRVDLLLLTATFGAMLTADLLFSYQATVGTYEHLYLPDLGWLSAFVLLAFAAAHAAPMPVERSRHVGYGRPVLYVSLGAAACTGLAQVLLHGSLRVTESLTALVLTFFAVARQFATETENRTLTDQLHRQVERAEATSARLEAVFDASRDPMVLVGPDRRVVEANRAAGRLYGLDPHDMVGMPASDLVHPNDLRTAAAAIELFVDQREVAPTTFRVVAADGAERWVEVTGANLLADPAVGALVVTLHDVTERKASAERMAYEAVHDQMTGLANRARFLEVAADAIAERDRVGGEVAMVFIDLDRFKVVNDSLGHQAGDRVLQVTAERLQANVRPTDLVARLGGDEFTVLLPGIREPAQAVEVAERVAAAIRQPITLDDGDTIITASIGVSIASPEITADMAELLLRDADLAMYRAKETGRARTELYADGTPRRERQTRLRIATDLHRAIERDELRVAYQPVVDLDNGRVTGFEALVRWQHPERGLLGPAEFVELAEDTGLITPIGEWVLSTACRRLAQWNDARAHSGLAQLSMAVNLSPRQLGDAALPDRVRACVAAAGVDPGLVWLEITENALMRETATAISVLRELRRVGVRLAVDDFGTGYSSLAYLKRFPVEALKIDRTFTDGLGSDPEDSAIVAAVVGMAHALNLEAVAEGLETYGQLAELRRLGCDRAQGYLFGRPMSAAELGPRPADDLSVWRTEPGTRSAEHLRPL